MEIATFTSTPCSQNQYILGILASDLYLILQKIVFQLDYN